MIQPIGWKLKMLNTKLINKYKKLNKMEKETFEEVTEKLVNRPYGNIICQSSFIPSTKSQLKKMYSEEEVLQLLLRLQQTESYDNLYDWFEQFKKK